MGGRTTTDRSDVHRHCFDPLPHPSTVIDICSTAARPDFPSGSGFGINVYSAVTSNFQRSIAAFISRVRSGCRLATLVVSLMSLLRSYSSTRSHGVFQPAGSDSL